MLRQLPNEEIVDKNIMNNEVEKGGGGELR